MASKVYDENSIQSKTPLEFTRLRPGVYVGSTDYSTQLLIEIVSNAIDEYKAGHGDKIIVTISEGNIISVEDNAQGFLVNSKRDDGKTVLQAAFDTLNTSGKYTEDGVYEGTALGLNGIGSKLVNFLSHWLDVTTYRDGKYEHIYFKEGVFEKRETGKTERKNGTVVTWHPSEEFFTNPEVNYAVVEDLFEVLSCLCPGLTIKYNKRGVQKLFKSKDGLNDLVDKNVAGNEILRNRFNLSYSEDKYKIDMVMTYTGLYSSSIVPYVNTGLTDNGPHITQIKTIITRELNQFFRDKGWLKEKDQNLSGEDCQEGLYAIFNITAPGVSYDAQTKTRIVRLDMKVLAPVIAEHLREWLAANEKDIKQIADKALVARKAREAARKAREAARNVKPKEKGLKAQMALSNKFIDCANKRPQDRNLILVEGVSAAAAVIEARNPKTDAIYLLRGKIISPLKTAIDKILANQEMNDIVRVIGAGFQSNFDVDKCQFDKIVIASDQDSDGLDIELLLITFFYTYMRPLVEAGKLYRAVTPLYLIRQKGKEYYCYSDDELAEWKNQHRGAYDLVRAKG